MKTFFSFLESEDLNNLEDLLSGFEDLGLQDRKWDEDQIRECLEELNWDDCLTFSVESFYIDWKSPRVKTKTNLDGSEFSIKPDIECKIGANLDVKKLSETLAEKLQKKPKTTQNKNLFTMEEILKGFNFVKWENIWSDFMDEISDNYKSWVKIKMEVEVEDFTINYTYYPINIKTRILFDDSDQAPFKMKDWDHINRVIEKIFIVN